MHELNICDSFSEADDTWIKFNGYGAVDSEIGSKKWKHGPFGSANSVQLSNRTYFVRRTPNCLRKQAEQLMHNRMELEG